MCSIDAVLIFCFEVLELSFLVFMVTVTSTIYILLENHRRRSSVEYVEDDMYEFNQLRQTLKKMALQVQVALRQTSMPVRGCLGDFEMAS